MRHFAALALASLLVLAACSQAPETPAIAAKDMGPAETVEASVAQLRDGDFVALLQTAVPAASYARMKEDWAARIKAAPASEQEKKEFAEMMAKITADDAEAALYAELEPLLAKAETEMAAQMPLMVGMGRGFAVQAIQESAKLDGAQKEQATALVDAFATWLQSAEFFDRDKAKQAIAIMVNAARAQKISTLDQVEALSFEDAMQRAGKLYLGFKDVLKVYEFDLDAALASVDTRVVEERGDSARVAVSYSLFAQPLSFETAMTRRDGRWFGSEALRELESQLASSTTPAVAPAAPSAKPGDAVEASDAVEAGD